MHTEGYPGEHTEQDHRFLPIWGDCRQLWVCHRVQGPVGGYHVTVRAEGKKYKLSTLQTSETFLKVQMDSTSRKF